MIFIVQEYDFMVQEYDIMVQDYYFYITKVLINGT